MSPVDHTPGAPGGGSLRVVVVGGGVAGLETLLALRAVAEDRVALTLVSGASDFRYVPLTVGEPFAAGTAARRPLDAIARELGAAWIHGAVSEIDAEAHRVVLASGMHVAYDVLVMCPGARARVAYERAITFDPSRETLALTGLLQDVEERYSERIGFIVPPGVTWSLPLYELALMTEHEVRGVGNDAASFTIVTPEETPLAILGDAGSDAVAALLEARGIEAICGAYAVQQSDGSFALAPGGRVVRFDRVVALPVLEGPAPAGLPADTHGFIPVDGHGRVDGVPDVYAAGDGTTFPVKQGGLATEQADAAAEHIAARAGAPVTPSPFRPVLRGKVLTGERPIFARRDLAGGASAPMSSYDVLWWPPHKVFGRFLAPFLAQDTRFDATGRRGETPPASGATDVETPLPGPPGGA